MKRCVSVLAACLALAACAGPVFEKSAATKDMPVDAGATAAAISRYRAAHGLGPVSVDGELMSAAEYQARAVAKVGYLSHEVGGSFPGRMESAGFGKRYAAENLSAGAVTIDQVLARWQKSPEHNKNLLMPQVKRIGIARVDAPETRFKQYWALVLSSS